VEISVRFQKAGTDPALFPTFGRLRTTPHDFLKALVNREGKSSVPDGFL
jgi:hypothetical protein